MSSPFTGSYAALPTPFAWDGLDLEAFAGLVEEHAAAPSAGVVVAGTTGEAATLSDAERRVLIDCAVEVAAGRCQVLAGVGTNDTRGTLELARFAASAGADGLLVVTPYYNRPGQRGLVAHFAAVAEASLAPVILYNVPSRTGTDLSPATAAAIRAASANVVSLKEASGDLSRLPALLEIDGLGLLAGDDGQIAAFLSAGADGVIGVVANLAPAEVAELCLAAGNDDFARTRELEAFLAPLVEALFVETNPVPLKAALALLGKCRADVRLPLVELEPDSQAAVESALSNLLASR